jgi:hypothetical protein
MWQNLRSANLEDEDVAKPLKSNSEDDEDEDVAKPLKSNSEVEDVFKSICGGDLKKKFSQIAANTFKSKLIDVHITEPFFKYGKNHWVVVYVDSGKAYVLKAQFILVHVSCLLRDWEKVKKQKNNFYHCNTYYEIGICKFKFGPESLWKHCNSGQPVKRMSFVYSCDSKEGATAGKEGLVQAINFFFMSMKERDKNPIGPFVLNHLKEKAEGLYNHLMKDLKTRISLLR